MITGRSRSCPFVTMRRILPGARGGARRRAVAWRAQPPPRITRCPVHVRVVPLSLTLLTLCAAGVAAGETHDLRALANRKPKVGEKVRTVEEETRAQNMPGRRMEQKPSATFVDEVLEVAEDGEPTRILRTYEALTDEMGVAAQVSGVKVLLTRDAATKRRAFAP